jgi:hypothetical protein
LCFQGKKGKKRKGNAPCVHQASRASEEEIIEEERKRSTMYYYLQFLAKKRKEKIINKQHKELLHKQPQPQPQQTRTTIRTNTINPFNDDCKCSKNNFFLLIDNLIVNGYLMLHSTQ